MPRKKLEIERTERLNLRLTKFELQKIERIAKEKNLTRTDAILQAIDLFIAHKPQKIANIKEIMKKRGVHFDDDDD
ncbi:MAG: hypothetical protein IJQ16_10465 [Selenomonadaceae bacterium]|nr:hypothetical protein [Selenomonadaceae bacterium]